MKFGYTIAYVADVAATIAFYEKAFGFNRRFIHESGQYGELDTGETTLSFAADAMADLNGVTVRPNRASDKAAAAIEICFVSDTPEKDFERAVAAGATPVKPVAEKPWGQRVGYLRDLNGCLIELCTPMAG